MKSKNSYPNRDLFKCIKNNLSENEKNRTSEWKKKVEIDGKIYQLKKSKENYYFSVWGNDGVRDFIFLGKTTFKDSNEDFIPISNLELNQYIAEGQPSKYFVLDTKNLNLQEIFNICKEGEEKTIECKYSPFLLELNEDMFKNKITKKEFKDLEIQDLSLFYLEYFPFIKNNIKDFTFIYSEERKLFWEEINCKIDKLSQSPVEVYGPFGIGKSTSLLAFQKASLLGKSAYFNLNSLFHLKDKNKIKKIILYESMTLFDDFKKFSELKDIINKQEYDSPWDIIKEVINFVSTKLNQISIIILDQYKELYQESTIKSSEKLDSILLNKNLGLNIIKCSSMNNTDVKINFLKTLENDNYIYVDKLFLIEQMDEKEKLYFGNISLFHYLFFNSKKKFLDFIEDEKKIIKSDIRKTIQKSANLLKVISNISNIMKTNSLFTEEEIKSILTTIPLKYIIMKKVIRNGTTFYTFDYPCLLIRIIFEELAFEELKYLIENSMIKGLRGALGGIFEIICHCALLGNKLKNFNLSSKKLFYLEKNLYNHQEKEENWKRNETDSKIMKALDSFYLRPTSSNSELYDSVIIFKDNEKFSAYLLQMSISKDHGKKIVSRGKHYNAIETFKRKIKTIYDIDLENVYFSYIFNYDEIMIDDIIECNRMQVDYFYYSIELDNFFQLSQEDKTISKNKISDKNKEITEKEKMASYPITKLDFNILSNMMEIKINTNFVKSKYDIEKDKYAFINVLNKKRKYEETSEILKDLRPINNIIKRKKVLKLEIYCKQGDLNQVLNI